MIRLRMREIAVLQEHNMSSLARASGVSFRTIKRIWRDPHTVITTDTLHKIAQALGVQARELIEEEPP